MDRPGPARWPASHHGTRRHGLAGRPPAGGTTSASRPSKPAPDLAKRPDEATITLFDVPEPEPASQARAAAPEPATPASPGPAATADAVLASPAYKENKKRAGRITVTDAAVGALLTALAGVAKPPAVPGGDRVRP